MKTRIHTNGSAMLIIAIVVTAVSVTALVGVGLAGSVSNSQSKLEKSQELKYVVFGATQLAVADLATGALIVGQSKTYYVGGNPIVVVAAVNPSPANTCTLTLTGANASMPVSTTCVAPYSPTVTENCWSYGIFSNASFTWPLLGANKVTGSVYFRDSISILGSGGQVTKDFKTASSFNPLSLLTIGGAILTGVTPKAFPTFTNTTYSNAATAVLPGNQTLNGYTFPSPNALVVVTGNLTVRGTIVGDGTLYVTGNISVNGNVTKQSSSHHIQFVTPGNITFSGGGSMTADGYYFSGGQMSIQSTLTNSGALVANNFNVSSGFSVTWDPWLTTTAQNGASLHAPGMWP